MYPINCDSLTDAQIQPSTGRCVLELSGPPTTAARISARPSDATFLARRTSIA
jgi:hypothetical protein